MRYFNIFYINVCVTNSGRWVNVLLEAESYTPAQLIILKTFFFLFEKATGSGDEGGVAFKIKWRE